MPTPEKYLKTVYGLELSDLDLTKETATIAEIDRLAAKFNLTRVENMTIDKAKRILQSIAK